MLENVFVVLIEKLTVLDQVMLFRVQVVRSLVGGDGLFGFVEVLVNVSHSPMGRGILCLDVQVALKPVASYLVLGHFGVAFRYCISSVGTLE